LALRRLIYFFPISSFSKSACMLRSAYIRISRRLSFGGALEPVAFAPHSMAFIWLTMDASIPPYFDRHQ
jgi:hypothetical protein